MDNNYKFLFNYFVTKKSISINNLSRESNLLNITDNDKKSIIELYKNDINTYIQKNKFTKNDLTYINQSNFFKNLSINFFDKYLLRGNIDFFFKEFISFRSVINNNKKNVDMFLILSNKILEKNYLTIENNLSFNNPIPSKDSKLFLIKEKLISNINNNNKNLNYTSHNNEKNHIKIILDVLTQGEYINLSYPSIGIISNYISNNQNNYIDLINNIINNTDINLDITSKIPLISLNIHDKISELLLDIQYENINNEDINYNLNNLIVNKESTYNLIKNLIKSISIKLENIYLLKDKNSNKRKNIYKKINSEFIIPYFIDNKKNEIKYIDRSEINKIKNFENLVNHNNTLFLHIVNNTFKLDNKEEGIKNLDKKYYKEILACYIFYIINIVNKILKMYIDEIDLLLKNISYSKGKGFGTLNIKNAFQFTTLLNKSILNFKKILLNNFYQLFIPSNIISGNYGMKIDEFNCYYPESIFLNSNEIIYEKYPFNNKLNYINNIQIQNISIHKDLLKEFILSTKTKYDIYKKNIILEVGGSCFNEILIKKSIKILSNYYVILQKNNNFNIFIIDKITEYFKNKNIPYELIENIENLKSTFSSSSLNNFERNDIEKKLLKKYEYNIEKSTNNYIKLISIRKKIEMTKNINIKNLYNLQDILFLSFRTYFVIVKCIEKITEISIYDTKLKNNLLKKYSEIKKKYENMISKHNN